MKTCMFSVVVEPDEDRWHADCPALVHQGAATWGETEQEALKNIRELSKWSSKALANWDVDDQRYPRLVK